MLRLSCKKVRSAVPIITTGVEMISYRYGSSGILRLPGCLWCLAIMMQPLRQACSMCWRQSKSPLRHHNFSPFFLSPEYVSSVKYELLQQDQILVNYDGIVLSRAYRYVTVSEITDKKRQAPAAHREIFRPEIETLQS